VVKQLAVTEGEVQARPAPLRTRALPEGVRVA